jgi:hypothetical protein
MQTEWERVLKKAMFSISLLSANLEPRGTQEHGLNPPWERHHLTGSAFSQGPSQQTYTDATFPACRDSRRAGDPWPVAPMVFSHLLIAGRAERSWGPCCHHCRQSAWRHMHYQQTKARTAHKANSVVCLCLLPVGQEASSVPTAWRILGLAC